MRIGWFGAGIVRTGTACAILSVALGFAKPVAALTPVTPLDIEACDAFLAAYAQCAADANVPEAVRPGLRRAINNLREGYRAAADSERARRTVAHQCLQAHAVTRQRLVAAYGCDFPRAAAGPVPTERAQP